jgi:hypothetical protein
MNIKHNNIFPIGQEIYRYVNIIYGHCLWSKKYIK